MNLPLKLSVVVSCYNQEKYIAACLDSILGQVVDFAYDLVIADDYSTDGTREVIFDYYENNQEKIKLLFQDKNVGAARNYISAHNCASGKYVAHFDGDDIMMPGKLQAQVDVLDGDPYCNIVFHRARYFSDDGTYVAETGCLSGEGESTLISREELARWGTIAVHSSYMYRRNTRTTREYSQDFMEWFFAFESIVINGHAAYIDKVLVAYRCNVLGSAYLASSAGRKKAYLIIMGHVTYYFKVLPLLRTELYAQQVINVLMYVKNTKEINREVVGFLIKNVLYVRPWKILDAIRVRKAVGPSRKVR
jgi:glycosyltransferase involved in cell wall biosynthesis